MNKAKRMVLFYITDGIFWAITTMPDRYKKGWIKLCDYALKWACSRKSGLLIFTATVGWLLYKTLTAFY